jgi:hypothetical protein
LHIDDVSPYTLLKIVKKEDLRGDISTAVGVQIQPVSNFGQGVKQKETSGRSWCSHKTPSFRNEIKLEMEKSDIGALFKNCTN